jgi:hypothetical protein
MNGMIRLTKRSIYFLVFLSEVFPHLLAAQENQGEIVKTDAKDTTSLRHFLGKGKFDAHLRLYYMSTNNQAPLSDYYALAFGGGIKYETGSFKGFRFGVGGFFIWNLSSSNLAKRDSLTGARNRYEIGQFDVENPENKTDLDRLEDFYLSYTYKKSFVRIGKQVINTPFINPQDGRMRPTGEQGVWMDFNEIPRLRVQAGWLSKISPRGTVRWMDVDESIGIYPSGVNTEGGPSLYKGNLTSAGVGMLGLTYQMPKGISIQLWDHYVDGIFNTVFIQAEGQWPAASQEQFTWGAQYIFQHPLKDGGNPERSKTYFDPEDHAQVFSLRTGYKYDKSLFRVNMTRITADGRFLMPREWGREPLYTFLPRERNEGSGDVKAISFNAIQELPRKKLRLEAGYGYYDMPEINQVRLNKYQFPSYHQFLADIRYQFGGFFRGLNIQFLYTYKKDAVKNIDDLKYVINKVNMHHMNLIMNYHF